MKNWVLKSVQVNQIEIKCTEVSDSEQRSKYSQDQVGKVENKCINVNKNERGERESKCNSE